MLAHRRTVVKRLSAGLALGSYLAVAVGIPLPLSGDKDRSRPFPCMDHPCGCRSAEQCWTHCCCFSPAERVAWARAHGVDVPAYAERPAPGGWHVTRLRDRAVEPRPACCARARATHPSAAAHADLSGRRNCCGAGREAARAPKAPQPTRWGPVVGALQCQGLGTLWASIGAALPALVPPDWRPSQPASGRLASVDSIALRVRPLPPDPPPRAC